MSNHYAPELGQLVHGNPPNEYKLSNFAEACFWMAKQELWRVWTNSRDLEEFGERGFCPPDHQPFGVTWRAYDWSDEPDDCPNFAWGGVEIRWYKYPGRGMSVNVDWTPDQWSDWLDKFLEYMHQTDKANDLE